MKKQKIQQEITENPPVGQFLNDLFGEGINILKQVKILEEREKMFIAKETKDKITTTTFDDFELELLDALHKRYFNWRGEIKNLLEKEDIAKKIDISISYKFYKIKNTPWFLKGLEYRNITSWESQELLNNIEVDTEKTLEFLNEIKPILLNIELEEGTDASLKIVEKWFNYKNNSISFYGEIYKPRRESQAKFIRQLVTKRQREKNNGTILKEGQRVSEKTLSNEIGITIEQLRQIKKQVSRNFKDKGFPMKIDSNAEGIMLIYTI